MVNFTNTNWADLTPGKIFTIEWDYETPSSNQNRSVTIDLLLKPEGTSNKHDILLGDPTQPVLPGTAYDWDVPYNIPNSAICTFIISERGNDAVAASTIDIKVQQQPTTRESSPVSLQYCFDAAANNCIDRPASTSAILSASSVGDSGSNSIANVPSAFSPTANPTTTGPSTLLTSTTPLITSPPTLTPTSLSTSTDQESSPHTLSTGAKAGVGVGAAIAVLIFAVVGFFLYKFGKRRALEKDKTTEYYNGWTATGDGKPEMSAEPLQKAEGGKPELDATPAPAYVERFPGGGGQEGDGSYVHPEEGFFRAELAGNSEFGIEPVPKHGGELEDTSGKKAGENTGGGLEDTSAKKTAPGIAEKTDDNAGEKADEKIAANAGDKTDPNGIGEAVSTDP